MVEKGKNIMRKIGFGLILMGILGTIIMLFGLFFAIMLIVIAPSFAKLIGIFFGLVMIFFIVALWIIILN